MVAINPKPDFFSLQRPPGRLQNEAETVNLRQRVDSASTGLNTQVVIRY